MIEKLHAKLLTTIAEDQDQTRGGASNSARDDGWWYAHAAVRAVVELHRPEFFGGVLACLACSPGMPPQILISYPCPTVQVVIDAFGADWVRIQKGETPK